MLLSNKIQDKISEHLEDKIKKLSDNYIILEKIASGSFGEVYIAQNNNKELVAAKVEEKFKPPKIYNEYKIYKYLELNNFTSGLPKIYDFIQTSDYNVMFMQLLGPCLEDIFVKNDKKFNLPTVLLLGEQITGLLEKLHSAHFVHRDIKPNNFLIGYNDPTQLYIMDFGLSKRYVQKNKHMMFRNNRSLIGTARYASINMHLGIEPTRRDDLESVGYMLLYFLKGSLPWQGLKKKHGISNLDRIGEIKLCTNLDIFCKDIPNCFIEYIKYCRQLKFDEEPNYTYLKDLFKNTANKLKLNVSYQWI